MKIATFFFSSTGNSWWAAKKITELFRESVHDSVCCSIEKNKYTDIVNRIDEFDLIGFSYPIYGANFPPLFRSFIDHLIENRSNSSIKPCFTLCTIGYVNGLGPFVAGQIFKKAHFKLVGHLNIKLSNNASAPDFKTNVFNGNDLESRKERALIKIKKYASVLINNRMMITGIGPYLLPGYIIRKMTKQKINNCNDIWSVDQNRCLHCNLCIKMCPTNSIDSTNGVFEFKNTCTACFRCYNTCPSSAILHMGIYADPKKYIRFKGPEKEWYKQMLKNE
jgi:ferredoxin/flavodoxin